MLEINVSKFSYATTVALLGDLLLGTVALSGIMYYSQKAHWLVGVAAHASGPLTVVCCVVALGLAYATGLVLTSFVTLIASPILAAASLRSGKLAAGFSPRPTWIALARTILARAGLHEIGADEDWRIWFQVFEAKFVYPNLATRQVYSFEVFGFGILSLLLMVGFPEARNKWMVVSACIELLAGGLGLFYLEVWAKGAENSQLNQEKAMMEFLLEKTGKQPEPESEK